MPISPQWTDERKAAIVIIYQGHWTWDEFQGAVDAINALMDPWRLIAAARKYSRAGTNRDCRFFQ